MSSMSLPSPAVAPLPQSGELPANAATYGHHPTTTPVPLIDRRHPVPAVVG